MFRRHGNHVSHCNRRGHPSVHCLLVRDGGGRVGNSVHVVRVLVRGRRRTLGGVNSPTLLLNGFGIRRRRAIVTRTVRSNSSTSAFTRDLSTSTRRFGPFRTLVTTTSRARRATVRRLSRAISSRALFASGRCLRRTIRCLGRASDGPIRRLRAISNLSVQLAPRVRHHLHTLVPRRTVPRKRALHLSSSGTFYVRRVHADVRGGVSRTT